jgi:hypothetical protein
MMKLMNNDIFGLSVFNCIDVQAFISMCASFQGQLTTEV